MKLLTILKQIAFFVAAKHGMGKEAERQAFPGFFPSQHSTFEYGWHPTFLDNVQDKEDFSKKEAERQALTDHIPLQYHYTFEENWPPISRDNREFNKSALLNLDLPFGMYLKEMKPIIGVSTQKILECLGFTCSGEQVPICTSADSATSYFLPDSVSVHPDEKSHSYSTISDEENNYPEELVNIWKSRLNIK